VFPEMWDYGNAFRPNFFLSINNVHFSAALARMNYKYKWQDDIGKKVIRFIV